ncbi:hypothetical protein B0T18DRAFT_392586 [Schizothecium vesticola]|uniref:Uncharacterized protein n=1 Tax=Schizothecium vesticola TaxID=314040 RepID=A0AA40EQY5_9PEZI|nr:hypothetical protein B0T18DRAFT_392586 [Schizothecium vesticola]
MTRHTATRGSGRTRKKAPPLQWSSVRLASARRRGPRYCYDSVHYGGIRFYDSASDPEALRFRQRAHVYSMRWARSHGAWQLKATGIFLRSGFCDSSVAVDQGVLHRNNPQPRSISSSKRPHRFALAAPGLCHERRDRLLVPWPLRFPEGGTPYAVCSDRGSPGIDQTHAVCRLGPVSRVGDQPALTAMSFAVVFWLRKVPVGPDFSSVAIMSGLEPDDLALLRGAAFSGRLQSPVRFDVTVVAEDAKDEEKGSSGGVGSAGRARIRYGLGTEPKKMDKNKNKTVLKRGCIYE